jgi:hypothetical protein
LELLLPQVFDSVEMLSTVNWRFELLALVEFPLFEPVPVPYEPLLAPVVEPVVLFAAEPLFEPVVSEALEPVPAFALPLPELEPLTPAVPLALLLAEVPLAELSGRVASFVGLLVSLLPVVLVAGWSDCGMLLAELPVEFIAVSPPLNEPRARTRSPTWSARLPAIMLDAVTGTSLPFLSRIVNCPLLALSRQPVTLSLPLFPLLARVSFCVPVVFCAPVVFCVPVVVVVVVVCC